MPYAYKIAVITDILASLPAAQKLATRLQLPFATKNPAACRFLLTLTPTHLELRENTKRNTRPLFVDFLSPQLSYRARHSNNTRQLIARAIGIKANKRLSIIDATAGLGIDAFIMTTLGCKVTMLERSPIVHALLTDGLQRLSVKQPTPELTLIPNPTSAHDYLQEKIMFVKDNEPPDVIYLDPMYPERKKSALGKKNLRILHDIVGDDSDIGSLLPLALKYATKRVVVKRPKLAMYINNLKPDVQFSARGSTRYDVYFTQKAYNKQL